jgi:hypothetical protein
VSELGSFELEAGVAVAVTGVTPGVVVAGVVAGAVVPGVVEVAVVVAGGGVADLWPPR